MAIYTSLREQSEREMRERVTAADKRISGAKREIEAAEEEKVAAIQKHEADLEHIAALEQSLPEAIGPKASRPKYGPKKPGVLDYICDVLPAKNIRFGLDEVYQWLCEAHPDKDFPRPSVRTFLHKLMDEGVIVRLQKGGGDRKAEYVVAGSDIDTGPYGDLSQIEICETIIRARNRRVTTEDIALEMLSNGYKPRSDGARFRYSLASTMRKNSRFDENEAGWWVEPKKANAHKSNGHT